MIVIKRVPPVECCCGDFAAEFEGIALTGGNIMVMERNYVNQKYSPARE